jgi:hypothetical protein
MTVKATISILTGALLFVSGGTAAATALSSPSPMLSAASFPAGGDTATPGSPTAGPDAGDVTWGS